MTKIFLVFLCLVGSMTSGLVVNAQKQVFSIYTGGGASGLQYDIQNGSRSLQPGFQAGFGYTRWLSAHWGIVSGLELGYYHTRATLSSNAVFTSNQVDSYGDAFQYRVQAQGYKEDQRLFTVNIPLQALYQTAVGHKTQWYAVGGVKLGLPVSGKYKTSANQVTTLGYYPDLNAVLTDLPQHGFGTEAGWTGSGTNEMKLSAVLSAETGLRFLVSSRHSLYAGFYFDYGLNNIRKGEGAAALATYSASGLTQSKSVGLFSITGETGAVRLMAYGIKLRWSFGSPKPRQAARLQKPEQVVAQAAPPVPVQKAEVDSSVHVIAKDTPAVVNVPDTLSTGELALLKRPVSFERVGDTSLSVSNCTQLDSVVALLKRHPSLVVQVQGHTCDIGAEAANERIGQARARVAGDYLKAHGIEGSRIQLLSKGNSGPLVPNTSEANRRLNRRVVFALLL